MYKLLTKCRACGNTDLRQVFDLGIHPLANDFCKADEPRQGYAPLKVLFCPKCTLSQLSVVVDPAILYSNYKYVTSPSKTMAAHFDALFNDIVEELGPQHHSILEIGSNDGTLLRHFKSRGFEILVGIDPAQNLADKASNNGITAITGMFSTALMDQYPMSPFDVVLARHVFAHVDDWRDFVRALDKVSDKETLIAIECPYVCDMLRDCSWDTIYHEHLSYLSLGAVKALLKDSPFRIHRTIHYPIHGGALLVMLRHKDCRKLSSQDFPIDEKVNADWWAGFSLRAKAQRADLIQLVRQIKSAGDRIGALGASAKSTVWINACQFTREHIEFIADSTSAKLYCTSPGSDIPIVDEGAILRELPDYVICFAWNFRSEILEKNALAREKGVKFIFPVPKVEIV
jgi:hypothetical protein